MTTLQRKRSSKGGLYRDYDRNRYRGTASICIPDVNDDGQAVGVLVATSSRVGRYTQANVQPLRDLAQSMGVAREFAKVIVEVSSKESSVGPECIVAWQYRRNGPIKLSPGFQAFDKNLNGVRGEFLYLPYNGNGMDMNALATTVMPFMMDLFPKRGRASKTHRWTKQP